MRSLTHACTHPHATHPRGAGKATVAGPSGKEGRRVPVLMTTEACQGGQPLLHDVSRAGEHPDVLGRWHGHITMPEGALRLRRRPGALSLTDF